MVGESGGGGKAEEDEDEDENLFNTDVIEIPVISALSKKEVRRVHAMIDRVISQRKRMMEKMSDIIGSLKDMCKSTEQARGVMQQKAIKETVQEQLRNAEILGDEITYQGKTLSMFTAVNVLFLPLGFFSQV
ncbi:hypothetical protein K440DRAFT_305690 [Wilcoxina mikolae CBS 423.85]|nr:hypothetical protein K440DRAFT_305690 [Wilcoxina mikolae CBS 423.85]